MGLTLCCKTVFLHSHVQLFCLNFTFTTEINYFAAVKSEDKRPSYWNSSSIEFGLIVSGM